MTDSISRTIQQRFRDSRAALRKEYVQKELLKKGNLRAGNSGLMNAQGEVAGSCVRKAHIRQLGIEIEEISEDKLIMFELGYANEDIIANSLTASLFPGESMRREEEIPINWQTSNGTVVSGRPDIVIGTEIMGKDKLPIFNATLGLELKSVHSVWTARTVLFEMKPKMPNLIQAAHYMWKLGVPFKLVYKAYSTLGQGMSPWMFKFFPRKDEPLSEYVDYNPKGDPKGIKQFEIAYDMRLDKKNVVEYKPENTDNWVKTLITVPDIKRFYEFTSEMETSKQLGPRPMDIDQHGNKLSFKNCAYCTLSPVCDRSEKKGYDVWLEDVKVTTGELNK